MNTKVLVVGLDGLEYNYVNDGDFPNLKQSEYGQVEIPITNIDEASTPIIWASFFTGVLPDEHGIKRPGIYRNRFVDLSFRVIGAIVPNNYFRSFLMKINPLRKWLKKFDSFKIRMPRKNELKVSTIFDEIQSSKHISIPILDVDVNERYKGLFDAIVNKDDRVKFIEFLWDDFEKDKEELYKNLNSYYFIMVQFQITDLIGHIYCKNRDKILGLYVKMDEFISTIKIRLSSDCLFLIISDHGVDEDYGHTNHGFYSSNKTLNLSNPHITDFYDMIVNQSKKNEKNR